MSFKDDPRYEEYRRKFIKSSVGQEHEPYVTVFSNKARKSNYHVPMIMWWPKKAHSYKVLDVCDHEYSDREPAVAEGMQIAKELGIEFRN